MHPHDRDRTALLVIDMQNGFCHPGGSITAMGKDISMGRAAIAPCLRLVEAARAAGVPVIFTRIVYRADYADRGVMPYEIRPALKGLSSCVAGTWDAALIDEITPGPGEWVFDKNRPSAFHNCPMESTLRSLDVHTLVVSGVTTNICVESTVRDTAHRDYRTFVVADATGELERHRHEAALESMAYFFTHVVQVDEVLAAWGESAR